MLSIRDDGVVRCRGLMRSWQSNQSCESWVARPEHWHGVERVCQTRCASVETGETLLVGCGRVAHENFDALRCQGFDEGVGVWELGRKSNEFDCILKVGGAVDGRWICAAG